MLLKMNSLKSTESSTNQTSQSSKPATKKQGPLVFGFTVPCRQGDSSGNFNLLATGEMTDKDSALVPYYSPNDVNTLSCQKD